MFTRLDLKRKLLFSYILVGFVPLAAMSLVSYFLIETLSDKDNKEKIQTVNHLQNESVSSYFKRVSDGVRAMATRGQTLDAMEEFSSSFYDFAVESKVGELSRQRSELASFYENEFGSKYRSLNGESANARRKMDQLTDNQIAIQHQFIAGNSAPLGEKDALVESNDSSLYSVYHSDYHPDFRKYLNRNGFYDIFLIDTKGVIVYSVFKELDFGTSLKDGPYSNSSLARVFKRASASSDSDQYFIEDFEPYYPSYEASAAFIAAPIVRNGANIGVLAFQFSQDVIDSVASFDEKWEYFGLGETGETILVGKNRLLRNKARGLYEDEAGYIQSLRDAGMPENMVDSVETAGTTASKLMDETSIVETGFSGSSSYMEFETVSGKKYIGAVEPLSYEGLDWLVITKISTNEAYGSLRDLLLYMVIVGLGGLAFTLMFGVTSSRRIANPLIRMMKSLSVGATEVKSASNIIAASSQRLAQGASEQAATLEETAASLEEIASMSASNTQNAAHADSFSGEVKSLSDTGVSAMEDMESSISQINQAAIETSDIIKIIDDIAFQTNLLALNAAVEAARAGDAGKGFAVVAEEVRSLAHRSAQAAADTSVKINRSKTLASEGSKVSKRVAESLEQISESSGKTAGIVKEIATASEEQSGGVSQASTAMAELDQLTQTNAAAAEESAASSEELLAQAVAVEEVVNSLSAMLFGGGESAPSSKVEEESEEESIHEEEVVSFKKENIPAPAAISASGSEDIIPFDDDFDDF